MVDDRIDLSSRSIAIFVFVALDQPKVDSISSSCSYGFARQYQGLFSTFDKEYSLIFDNPSPDSLSPASIRQCRLEKEQEDFNEEYCLADNDEFPDQTSILNYSITLDDQLSDQDRDDLKNLKYKQHLIDDPIPIYLGLIDLLYAFAYDQRITQ
jgi:protein SHQ1